MKTRNFQVFVAPGSEDAELPLDSSPWHVRRWVRLPYEHWALILDYASTIDPNKAAILDRLSRLGASNMASHSANEMKEMAEFLRRLSALLPATRPLVEQAAGVLPKNHPNEEHARMCDAVAAVMPAGAETGNSIRSWVE
jgi:hypothetical protein